MKDERRFGRIGLRRISGLTLILLGTVLMSSMGVLDGGRAKYIHVRWRPDVGANIQAELEARFSLGQPHRVDGQTFGYDLLDDSSWNIRALVRHAAVVDTHHIDRERFTVAATAEDGDGDRRTGLAWRWHVEHLVPYVPPFGAVLVTVGFALCVSRRHLTRALAWRARTGARVSNYLRAVRAGHLTRRSSPAVLAVLAIVGVRLLSGWDSTTGESDVWVPWFERQAWAPLQRVVTAALLAAGALMTFRVAARQSGAPWVALAIILVTVWVFPVRGSEAGFVLYTLVLWAGSRYIDRPGREGFWLLTLLTVMVSAFRVDHGLYVAVAAVAALFARHVRDGARAFGRAALGYAGSLAVMALLFVPLGQVHASLDRLGDRITDVVAARGELRGSLDAGQQSEASRVVERTFNVRWAPGVDAAQREAKEREHALAEGREDRGDASGLTWQYRWDGRSPASVRRLLNDPAVEDTHGIDRASAQFVGRNSAPDNDLEWINALLSRASEVASAAAARGLRWLWVILPIAAALRLGRRAMRRPTAHPGSHADVMVLPALVLCMPIGWLVMQGAGDLVPVAAPVMPALAVVTTWLFTGPFEDDPQTQARRRLSGPL